MPHPRVERKNHKFPARHFNQPSIIANLGFSDNSNGVEQRRHSKANPSSASSGQRRRANDRDGIGEAARCHTMPGGGGSGAGPQPSGEAGGFLSRAGPGVRRRRRRRERKRTRLWKFFAVSRAPCSAREDRWRPAATPMGGIPFRSSCSVSWAESIFWANVATSKA